jgi:hypothetical protein
MAVQVSGPLRRARYRVRQFTDAVGAAVSPLTPSEHGQARAVLPAAAWPLFEAMPRADQRHSLRVWRTLRARGRDDRALAQAALLHDCAKRQGGVTLMHRVAVVLLKAYAPETLRGWAAIPAPGPGGWRQPFWAHAHHPEAGAALAAQAGCDPAAVDLIRRHQDPPGDGPSDHLLAALQAADDDN